MSIADRNDIPSVEWKECVIGIPIGNKVILY